MMTLQPTEEPTSVALSTLKLDSLIGRGRTSQVYRASSTQDTSQIYAVKLFADPEMSEDVAWQEAQIYKLVQDHPNIAKLISFENDSLVIEYMPHCDFYAFLRGAEKPLPVTLARYLFRCIVLAVMHLHSKLICHRDLKLENVLLDKNFVPKLCDFDSALRLESDCQKLETSVGTQGYLSPQQVRREAHNAFKSDIFALGTILFLMVQGVSPFHELAAPYDPYYKHFFNNKEENYWQALKKKYPHYYYDEQFINLVNGMLRENEDERFTIFEVEKHPWIRGETMDEAQRIQYMQEQYESCNNQQLSFYD